MNRYNYLSLVVLVVFLLAAQSSAITSRVRLDEGCESGIRKQIEENLNIAINCLEPDKISMAEDKFTDVGFEQFRSLIKNFNCQTVNPLYKTKLIQLPFGGYEVRDIKVQVTRDDVQATDRQKYLVFELNEIGLINDVRVGLSDRRYKDVIREGEILQDFAQRQQILQFIELYRTAHNRKDIDFLEKVYSDSALFLIGKVLKVNRDIPDMLEQSNMSDERVVIIRKNKTQYVSALRKVFANNEYLEVKFDEIEIFRHPVRKKVYGITLKQRWKSTSYSDEGYLFLMMDLTDEELPKIHVRSWQQDRFPDGSVVSLGDFQIID